jgi:exonuclease SbcD
VKWPSPRDFAGQVFVIRYSVAINLFFYASEADIRSHMPNFSFVHAADLHLDSPFAALNVDNPDLVRILRSATFEAFDRVIRLCLEEQVDFLLVAGDVYDGSDRSLRAQVKFRDGLQRLHEAGIRSFVVHGNHDPLDGWSSTLEWPSGVHVFGEHLETTEVKRDGSLLARVQGISYPKRDERRNLSLLFQPTDSAFHIALLHANVGSDTGHEPYAPCTLEDLIKSEIDYWALGHVHSQRVLSAHLPFVVYPGNTQGRNIKETGEKGCYLVKVGDDKEVELDFRATDVIRWTTYELSIHDLQTEQDLINALDHACVRIAEKASDRPSIARITLSGRSPLFKFLKAPNSVADLLEILHERGPSYSPSVWVEQILLSVGPDIDPIVRMKERDFLGDLIRYSRELMGEKRLEALVREDLAPLFESSRIQRYIDAPGDRQLRELLEEAERICLENLHGEEAQ